MEFVGYIAIIVGAIALGYMLINVIKSVDKETDRIVNENYKKST